MMDYYEEDGYPIFNMEQEYFMEQEANYGMPVGGKGVEEEELHYEMNAIGGDGQVNDGLIRRYDFDEVVGGDVGRMVDEVLDMSKVSDGFGGDNRLGKCNVGGVMYYPQMEETPPNLNVNMIEERSGYEQIVDLTDGEWVQGFPPNYGGTSEQGLHEYEDIFVDERGIEFVCVNGELVMCEGNDQKQVIDEEGEEYSLNWNGELDAMGTIDDYKHLPEVIAPGTQVKPLRIGRHKLKGQDQMMRGINKNASTISCDRCRMDFFINDRVIAKYDLTCVIHCNQVSENYFVCPVCKTNSKCMVA
uniref:RING-type domain-containing protein n=1 Tax=Rhabditophanes sp. KR3021 TaxID=114890 RepID=A0AC35UAR5_9BILA